MRYTSANSKKNLQRERLLLTCLSRTHFVKPISVAEPRNEVLIEATIRMNLENTDRAKRKEPEGRVSYGSIGVKCPEEVNP